MTAYVPVATSDITRGVPVRPVRFNGDGGVRKEWWWQAGPVDSCCCCCSLRAGVGILATFEVFVSGIWGVFFKHRHLMAMLDFTIEVGQEQYNRACNGISSGLNDHATTCANLKESIENAQHVEDVLNHEPVAVTILGVLFLLAGMVGLWAVFSKSASAAKLYLWSWPVTSVLAAAVNVMQYRLMSEYHVDRPPLTTLSSVADIFFFFYYLKVCWSFHVVLKKRNKAAASNEAQANALLNPSGNVV